MDEKQSRIVDVLLQHKDCLNERSKLKGILADCLPDDKMHQNLVLYAYDEDFYTDINQANEKALVALQFIKVLEESYGISAQNAKWSIEVWCAVLGFNEIVDAFSSISTLEDNDNKSKEEVKNAFDESKEYVIGVGLYCAGIDFPAGRIVLKAKWGKKKGDIEFGIKSTPNIVRANDDNNEQKGKFVDQVYIDIAEGKFIKTEDHWEDVKEIIAKKISD